MCLRRSDCDSILLTHLSWGAYHDMMVTTLATMHISHETGDSSDDPLGKRTTKVGAYKFQCESINAKWKCRRNKKIFILFATSRHILTILSIGQGGMTMKHFSAASRSARFEKLCGNAKMESAEEFFQLFWTSRMCFELLQFANGSKVQCINCENGPLLYSTLSIHSPNQPNQWLKSVVSNIYWAMTTAAESKQTRAYANVEEFVIRVSWHLRVKWKQQYLSSHCKVKNHPAIFASIVSNGRIVLW